jgi:hypothetical protein
MKMKKTIYVCALILATAIFAQAQIFLSEGKLNTWTTEKVQRNPQTDDYASGICKIRVSKNKGFDRVVFEFDSGKPTYVLQYLPANLYPTEGGDKPIKAAGNYFLMLNIYYFAVGDEMPCKLKTYPKKKLDFPTLIQLQEGGWFEGIIDYLIGVKDKKPFRVIELRNPTRLVIDFKH